MWWAAGVFGLRQVIQDRWCVSCKAGT